MPFPVTVLLVIAVHLATNLAAWDRVGLLADDRFAVGMSAYWYGEHTPFFEQLHWLFWKEAQGLQVALYRPFLQLSYVLEYPLYGTQALGYHVTNSVLHCATALLWGVLVRRLSGSAMAATAAAVAFVGWPGHGEATHWIASRVNLLSAFWMSVALCCWVPPVGKARGLGRVIGTVVCAVIALGCKESAVLVVPLLLLADVLRTRGADEPGSRWLRLARLGLASLPVWIAMGAWLWLRATRLHTWGTGAAPVWQLDVWSPAAWFSALWSWLRVILVPVHMEFRPWMLMPLGLLHVLLLWSAWRARDPGSRRTLWFGAATCACCVVAIAGLHHDPHTLEGGRHSYEAALGFAVLLGLGIAALPGRCQRPALLLLILVHAVALDGNRENWLRAGALRRRYEAEAFAAAARSPEEVRILDVPSVWHGAFVQLVEDPTVFRPPFAPDRAKDRGRVSLARDWEAVLHELASRAARKEPLGHAFTVGWADGELIPLPWDDRWPLEVVPGVTIGFARLGRARPYVGTTVPVQLLISPRAHAVLKFTARSKIASYVFADVELAGVDANEVQAVDLFLAPGFAPGEPVAVELQVSSNGNERTLPIGEFVPAAWSVRPW